MKLSSLFRLHDGEKKDQPQVQKPINTPFNWLAYTAAILALWMIAPSAVHAVQPTGGISFAQVTPSNSVQTSSSRGELLVTEGALFGSGYVNVELFEDGRAAGWAVKNLPVMNGSLSPGAKGGFDLPSAGLQYSLSAYVDFSPTPLTDDISLRQQVPLTYLLAQVSLPTDDNPNQFEDVVCHQDDKKFWTGQASVMSILTSVNRDLLIFKDGTGWIVKGKDAGKVLMMTASHNFTDGQAKDTSVTVDYQKTKCGGQDNEKFWVAEVDQVLERNPKLDFLIVSLKAPPKGKTYPPPLQPFAKKIPLENVVTIPQHPAEVNPYKKGGYYYDIANQKRCMVTPTPLLNERTGQVDAKCGAVHGTSGSPMLDAAESDDNTPYAIALIVGCRLEAGQKCKALSAVGYKMSNICAYDAGADGKKLLDCKQPD